MWWLCAARYKFSQLDTFQSGSFLVKSNRNPLTEDQPKVVWYFFRSCTPFVNFFSRLSTEQQQPPPEGFVVAHFFLSKLPVKTGQKRPIISRSQPFDKMSRALKKLRTFSMFYRPICRGGLDLLAWYLQNNADKWGYDCFNFMHCHGIIF